MKIKALAFTGLLIFIPILAGCSKMGPRIPPALVSTMIPKTNPNALFINTDSIGLTDTSPHIARYRFVKLNLALLIDENGKALNPGTDAKITLNLFPDVSYTGVIKQIQEDSGVISWVGYLEDVEYSELTMVFTAGTFMAHFASPLGIYEVSNAGGDVYRIVQIDQTKLPGGEGDIEG